MSSTERLDVDLFRWRLARLLGQVHFVEEPLARAKAAHEALEAVRDLEVALCEERDDALRLDRDTFDSRTVDMTAAATGIGRSTVVNARRYRRTSTFRERKVVTDE